MLFRLVQPENAPDPMLLILSGRVTFVSFWQSLNAAGRSSSPPVITTVERLFLGIVEAAKAGAVTEVILSHPPNAL